MKKLNSIVIFVYILLSIYLIFAADSYTDPRFILGTVGILYTEILRNQNLLLDIKTKLETKDGSEPT